MSKPSEHTISSMSQPTDMLDILSPRRVAILGASDNHIKAGGRPIHYMLRHGYAGEIYPVNPARDSVQGVKSYPSLLDLPHSPDVVVVSIAGKDVPSAIDQAISIGAKAAVVYSSGFAELGEEGLKAQHQLVAQARAGNLRLLGPNTQGIANFKNQAILSFSTMINECPPQDGPVAIISQSGAGAAIVYGGLRRQNLGVRYLVATGNEADMNVADVTSGLLQDPDLRVILMYAESLRDPLLFAQCAQVAATRDIPILAVMAGRTQEGQLTASSHTGALATEDALTDAFLRQHNIIRMNDFHELTEYAHLFSKRERPRGKRVVAISNSGATCVLAADAAQQNGLQLARFDEAQTEGLRGVLPSFVSPRNPIDMTTALLTQPHIYGETLQQVAESGAAHSVFTGFPIGGEGYDMDDFARQTADFSARAAVPVAIGAVQDWVVDIFRKQEVPVFPSEARAMRGLGLLADYEARRRRLLALPPKNEERRQHQAETSGYTLDEPSSLAFLSNAGLNIVAHRVCRDKSSVDENFTQLNTPVVAKGVSAAVPHKSDHGLVRLGLRSPDEARDAWQAYQTTLEALRLPFEGMLLAEQHKADFELALGAHWDATYGPVVMIGQGGVLVEALRDTQFLCAPFTQEDALEAIDRLFISRAFIATRGMQAVDVEAIATLLVKLGDWFAAQAGTVLSVDANPVLVSRNAAPVIVDAVVVKSKEQP
ncbi:acetate--CoA ligase family protein [Achromobacter sp. F4_2707]|uniref:acetate--CoA ligase family protein n=1 Tax=Achromobacter sp. F4_2707 TaxID=3114286 RepID=UPI0039C705E4